MRTGSGSSSGRRTLIVLLSFSGEQRARYFLPLWPVFALLVAEFCVRGAERARGLVDWSVALISW